MRHPAHAAGDIFGEAFFLAAAHRSRESRVAAFDAVDLLAVRILLTAWCRKPPVAVDLTTFSGLRTTVFVTNVEPTWVAKVSLDECLNRNMLGQKSDPNLT